MSSEKPVKTIDKYKIDEILEDNAFEKGTAMDRLLKKPIKLVAIGYTVQDANGTQAEIKVKSNDFIEDEDYEEDENEE